MDRPPAGGGRSAHSRHPALDSLSSFLKGLFLSLRTEYFYLFFLNMDRTPPPRLFCWGRGVLGAIPAPGMGIPGAPWDLGVDVNLQGMEWGG